MQYKVHCNHFRKRTGYANFCNTSSIIPHAEHAVWQHYPNANVFSYSFDDTEARSGARFEKQEARLQQALYHIMLQEGSCDFGYFIGSSFEGLDLERPLVPPGGTRSPSEVSEGTGLFLKFYLSNLQGANFKNAKLKGARFTKCVLNGADFTGADLTNVTFHYCLMYGVKGLPPTNIHDEAYRGSHSLTGCSTGDWPTDHSCLACGDEAAHNWINGFRYCSDCYGERLHTCEGCMASMDPDFLKAVRHPRAGQGAGSGNAIPTKAYCPECVKQYAFTCPTCRGLTSHGSGYCVTDEDSGLRYCVLCRRPEPRAILNYSHKPPPDWRILPHEMAERLTINGVPVEPPKPKPKLLCFGHELEVQHKSERENLNRFAAEVSRDGFWYCKSDASIGHGFECVSHPFSWDWLKRNAKSVILPKMEYLISNKFRSWNTECCGLHIHMSRDAFETVPSLPRAATQSNPASRYIRFYTGGNRWASESPLPTGVTRVTRGGPVPSIQWNSSTHFHSGRNEMRGGPTNGFEYAWDYVDEHGVARTYYAFLDESETDNDDAADHAPSPHLYRFQQFFYKNPDFARLISGRSKRHMRSYGNAYMEDLGRMSVARIARGLAMNPVRGMAVNLNTGHTVEVRLFKGTLKFYSFLRAHQFCHALFTYTKHCGNGQLSVQEFHEFVRREKHEYPQLLTFMNEEVPTNVDQLQLEVQEIER
jgi:hypothetical protein